jgi:hypothetical protein
MDAKTQDIVCEYMFWLKMLCFFDRIEKDFLYLILHSDLEERKAEYVFGGKIRSV